MTESNQKAEEIIERFGGIRPMASKMGIPVTTVQGWKKRDAIPDNRVADVLASAHTHKIDVSDLIAGQHSAPQSGEDLIAEGEDQSSTPVKEEEKVGSDEKELLVAEPVSSVAEDEKITSGDDAVVSGHADSQQAEGQSVDRPPTPVLFTLGADKKDSAEDASDSKVRGGSDSPKAPVAIVSSKGREDSARSVARASAPANKAVVSSRGGKGGSLTKEEEVNAVKTSTLISIIMILLVAIASASYLWPMLREHNARISDVETQVDDLRGNMAEVQAEQKESRAEAPPKSWAEQLAAVQKQAEEATKMAQASLNSAVSEASKLSEDVMEGGVVTAYEKVKKFDKYVTDKTAESPMLQGFVNALDSLLEEEKGRKTLGDASSALLSAFNSVEEGSNSGQVEDVIEDARLNDPAAAEIFEGVPKEDLKKAGVMLSLSQIKDSISQDGQPFDQDLGLLKNLVGEDDPDLRAAIEGTEDEARKGVFGSEALASLLDGLSGKVVDSSLEGEDVSMTEQAKARLNSLIQVEKDGDLVTGTSTQATLNKAKNLLAKGDLRGARAVVDTLPEDQRAHLAEWIEKTDASIRVEDLSLMLDRRLGSLIGVNDYLSSLYVTRQQKGLR